MSKYAPEALVRIARRKNNKKRSYLFVNPLQAKHIPVSPTKSLTMMRDLGARINLNNASNAVVVGFAETATAIGAVVASTLGEDVKYIHTTRETLPGNPTTLGFLEEHSHATDQALCSASLEKLMRGANELIFVDDEYSTGRTFLNALSALSKAGLLDSDPHITAVSVLNRIDDRRLSDFSASGIAIEYLLRLGPEEYIGMYDGVETLDAKRPTSSHVANRELNYAGSLGDPRTGVSAKEYWSECTRFAREVIATLPDLRGQGQSSILVLGTEECMAPALALGSELESSCPWMQVRCHATTRSPISISNAPGYPIFNGTVLRSVYDPGRETYIYNLQSYDFAIVVTDANKATREPGVNDLTSALFEHGCGDVLVVALR